MTTLAALAAFVRRDWLVARTYRFRLAMGFAGQLFQLATFFFLSRTVNPTTASGIDGRGGYFGFVVAGLVMVGLASTGLTTFATRIDAERAGGSLEAMLTTPTSPAVLVIGTAAYGLCSAVLGALMMLAAAIVLFGFDVDATPGTAVVAVVALAATVVWVAGLGVVVAAFTLVVQRGSVILQFATAALPLLGGVYFVVDTLPEPLETIARLFPFAWGLDAIRDSLAGERADPAKLGLLILAAALMMPLALWIFEVGLRHVRRTGTLSHF